MGKVFGLLLLLLVAAGCSVVRMPVAIDGGKTDGRLVYGFTYPAGYSPVVDWAPASEDAAARCAAWGFDGTEPYPGVEETCVSESGIYGISSCDEFQVVRRYQCLEGR